MEGSENEEYEVLDVRGMNDSSFERLMRRVMGDVSRQTAAKQMAIGSVTGVVAGYLAVKVGKVAAATLGTTVLLVQVAQHQGYININWDRVKKDLREAEIQVHQSTSQQFPGFFNNLKQFVQENMFLAVGFGGGFMMIVALFLDEITGTSPD